MKRLYLGFFLLFILRIGILAQDQVSYVRVEGTVTDDIGEPAIGSFVTVKGTTIGTMVGLEGTYEINVPEDPSSILVFSFIGCETVYETVGLRRVINVRINCDYYDGPSARYRSRSNPYARSNVKPVEQPDMSGFIRDYQSGKEQGITMLADDSPTVPGIRYRNISGIRRFVKKKDNTYDIRELADSRDVKRGMEMTVTSSVGWEQVTRLPDTQDTYAQGMTDGTSLQWMGPALSVPFSWGPPVQVLEFDGTSYPYDRNGKLVPKGTGNGTPAQVYDAASFFRTGFRTNNNMTLRLPGISGGYTQVELGQNLRNGNIRESRSEAYRAALSLKKITVDHFSMDVLTSYSIEKGRLFSHGANQAGIIGAILMTPVTFDNANGMSPADAQKSESTWRLPSGSVRSYAPGIGDNPYGLTGESPDKDRVQQGMAGIFMNYEQGDWKLGMSGSVNIQQDDRENGAVPGFSVYPGGRFMERSERRVETEGKINALWRISYRIDARMEYSYQHQYDKMNRWDGFDFRNNYADKEDAGYSFYNQIRDTRNISEILYGIRYRFPSIESLAFRVYNRHYFSNTAGKYTNIFPSAGLDANLFRILGIHSYKWHLELNVLASRSLREAPLIFGSDKAVASILLPVMAYRNYYESQDFSVGGLKPEISANYEGKATLRWRELSLEVRYADATKRDYIVQGYYNGIYQVHNAARVNTRSWNATAYYSFRALRGTFRMSLQWLRLRSKVSDLYNGEEYIPVSGFTDITTALVKGQPAGAIYGTTFQRDNAGQMIIDQDGFPVKDGNMKMIGNPEPDWTINFQPGYSSGSISISCLLEIRKGGKMWNGTRAMLDYLGRSAATADERMIQGYVFDGVTGSGQVNTQSVDFYNPSQDMTLNRWVRYGASGVGEEYIEDASWIRLSDVSVSWSPRRDWSLLKNFSIGFSIRNLFLITRYKGVDPKSALFNDGSATGLDLFNNPGVRSYLVNVNVKFTGY